MKSVSTNFIKDNKNVVASKIKNETYIKVGLITIERTIISDPGLWF